MAASWWPATPASPDASAWRDDLALLWDEHDALVALVRSLRRGELTVLLPGHRTAADQLVGTALHDAYHAGQMMLVRRLAERPSVSGP
jgi:hypothetical protein